MFRKKIVKDETQKLISMAVLCKYPEHAMNQGILMNKNVCVNHAAEKITIKASTSNVLEI